ncbi:MAG: FecR domain-containing protein [Phycisphaeraceae bacterium]
MGRNRAAFVLAQEEPPKKEDAPKENPPKAEVPVEPVAPAGADPKKEDPAKEKEPAKEQVKQLKITIVAIQGFAQVKQAADKPWQPAKVGMELSPGADLRTALRSVVQIKIDPGHIITLDRLGTIKVIDAVQQGSNVKTDIGMQYGRTSYEVEKATEPHEATVHTPGTVMAVRGTFTINESDAFTERVQVLHGMVDNRFRFRREITRINPVVGTSTVTVDFPQAAAHAMNKTVQDARGQFTANTLEDERRIAANPIGNGADLSNLRGVDLTRIQAINLLAAELSAGGGGGTGVPEISGPLTFTLVWNDPDFLQDVNLDMTVTTIDGTVSRMNPVVGTSPTQGQFNVTSDGDGIGGFGSEEIKYPLFFKQVTYTIQVTNTSTTVPADFFIIGEQGPNFDPVAVSPTPPMQLAPGQTYIGTAMPK